MKFVPERGTIIESDLSFSEKKQNNEIQQNQGSSTGIKILTDLLAQNSKKEAGTVMEVTVMVH